MQQQGQLQRDPLLATPQTAAHPPRPFCLSSLPLLQIYERNPTTVKNYGIWVRYQSRTGYHNAYKVGPARGSGRQRQGGGGVGWGEKRAHGQLAGAARQRRGRCWAPLAPLWCPQRLTAGLAQLVLLPSPCRRA